MTCHPERFCSSSPRLSRRNLSRSSRSSLPATRPSAAAAAQLHGLKAHVCAKTAQPEYTTQTVARKPRDPKLIAVLVLGNSLTYFENYDDSLRNDVLPRDRAERIRAIAWKTVQWLR